MTVGDLIKILGEYEPEERLVVTWPNMKGDPPPLTAVHSDYHGRVNLEIVRELP